MSRTDFAERTARAEEAFKMPGEAPVDAVPAVFTQIIESDRPKGAMKVEVDRDDAKVRQKIKQAATAAGDDFFYSWTVKNKDGTKGIIEGPSVKCANAVARLYGNCSVKVRAFDQAGHWILYAQFYDFETGFVYERPFQQRKAQNLGGKMDAERAQDIVFQIGVSKAARNVVCNALSELTDYAFAIAKEEIVKTIGKDIAKYQARVKQRMSELRVDISRVEAVRGKLLATWTAMDLARTIAEIQAVADGMIHPDDVWPMMEAGAPRPTMEDTPEAGATPDKQKPAGGNHKSAPDKQPEASVNQKPENDKPSDGRAESHTAPAEPQAAQPSDAPREAEQAAHAEPAASTAETIEEADHKMRAFSRAEDYLDSLKDDNEDGLAGCKDAGDVDRLHEAIREALKSREDLDAEDAAVLISRWNAMVLERKRALTRRGRK